MSADLAAKADFSHIDTGIGKTTAKGRKLFSRRHATHEGPVVGWDKILGDAEYLLDYASQAGIPLPPELIETIISVGRKSDLSPEETTNGIIAITNLAAKLQPVTAESLRACQFSAGSTIRK